MSTYKLEFFTESSSNMDSEEINLKQLKLKHESKNDTELVFYIFGLRFMQ